MRQNAVRLTKSAAVALPPVRRLIEQRDRLIRQRDELRVRCEGYRAERDALARLGAMREAAAAGAGAPARAGVGAGVGAGASDGAPARDADRFGYLFLLTYGRSGSTLLQNLLSTAPGVLIRGENQGVLYHLCQYHSRVLHHRDRLAPNAPLPSTHPWWGIDGYPEQYALDALRHLVLDTLIRPLPDSRVVGFKEIDWPSGALPGYVSFLRAVFPGARFVVNTRDLEATSRSKWWARRPDAAEHLAGLERQLLDVAEELGDDAFRVHYDDYCADHDALRPLFDWLDAPFDRDLVDAVMTLRHSY
ncbi:sulfotransferase [Actinacidiphila sp. DG2A-62]|uniref:sulfotransferase n=1 Tax=Actinacidiphila sp. DG2A-62 TaxID=3108821 RepID=UPI002DB5FF30|nr:sulfotransferase [Actinacidiphila sp. DG2A-62]MEC3995782.1 sulfotransferase [Actinacidiphila sp. DG2A-62]